MTGSSYRPTYDGIGADEYIEWEIAIDNIFATRFMCQRKTRKLRKGPCAPFFRPPPLSDVVRCWWTSSTARMAKWTASTRACHQACPSSLSPRLHASLMPPQAATPPRCPAPPPRQPAAPALVLHSLKPHCLPCYGFEPIKTPGQALAHEPALLRHSTPPPLPASPAPPLMNHLRPRSALAELRPVFLDLQGSFQV